MKNDKHIKTGGGNQYQPIHQIYLTPTIQQHYKTYIIIILHKQCNIFDTSLNICLYFVTTKNIQ